MEKWQQENPENSQNSGAPRAKRAAHLSFWIFLESFPRNTVLSSERISGQRAKTLRKTMREAAHFWCPFSEFLRGGTRSRIVFLEVFARWPLIMSDDNTEPRSGQAVIPDSLNWIF